LGEGLVFVFTCPGLGLEPASPPAEEGAIGELCPERLSSGIVEKPELEELLAAPLLPRPLSDTGNMPALASRAGLGGVSARFGSNARTASRVVALHF